MSSIVSPAFTNVFSAFSLGLEGRAPTKEVADPGAAQEGSRVASIGEADGQFPATIDMAKAPELDTLGLVGLLQALGQSDTGSLPFADFALRVPGDPVATLSSMVRLMNEGWVEVVGQISEKSEVRLTTKGRSLLEVLNKAVSKP